jgi:hypothetical protein
MLDLIKSPLGDLGAGSNILNPISFKPIYVKLSHKLRLTFQKTIATFCQFDNKALLAGYLLKKRYQIQTFEK